MIIGNYEFRLNKIPPLLLCQNYDTFYYNSIGLIRSNIISLSAPLVNAHRISESNVFQHILRIEKYVEEEERPRLCLNRLCKQGSAISWVSNLEFANLGGLAGSGPIFLVQKVVKGESKLKFGGQGFVSRIQVVVLSRN